MGRHWTAEGTAQLRDELSGSVETLNDMLCIDDEQRLLLLGALLELVGTDRAVRLGPLRAWKVAIALRQEDLDWDSMPHVGVERWWLAGCKRISFRKRLELQSSINKRRR